MLDDQVVTEPEFDIAEPVVSGSSTSDGTASSMSLCAQMRNATIPWTGMHLCAVHQPRLATTPARSLAVELEREEDGRWLAEVPQLPGVMAYGNSPQEAGMAVTALALRVLNDRLKHDEAPGGSLFSPAKV